jgi:hypothetical protein
MVEGEVWKPIDGFEGAYEVSNFGRVKSIKRLRRTKGGGVTFVSERMLKPAIDHFGYCKVVLTKNGKRHYYKVHRLVAIAFIPNPENKPEVNHKDGDKTNNCITNLEWNTPTENKRHAFAMGLNGGDHMTHRKSVNQYDKNKHLIDTFPSIADAARQTGACHSSIWMCCNHKYKTAGGYIWEYAKEMGDNNGIYTP